MDTIITVFEKQVKERPEAAALHDADVTVSYRQLNEQANQLARYFQDKGIQPDTAIAICMDRSPLLFAAIFGILKSGGAYVPLDPAHPEERLFYTLEDNHHPILLVQKNLADKFKAYTGLVIILEETCLADYATTDLTLPIQPSNLAYIIYTSGSTGKPKGVQVEHESVVNYANWFADYAGCKPLDIIDFSANYIFDMSISVSIVPLMLGMTIQICDNDTRKDSRKYLQHLQQKRVNIIKITPGSLKLLLHETKAAFVPLPDLRQIVLGGENLTKSECESWFSMYPSQELFNEYGPTEATIAVSHQKISRENVQSMPINIPIGKTGPGMHCYILDDNCQPVQPGEKGELHITGICLARGYLNKPELTAARFIENDDGQRFYKTGDLCSMQPDNTIEYFGRMDDQIKIRGFRVEPEEIVQSLMKHPAILEAVVFAPEEYLKEKRLIAWYILKPDHQKPGFQELQQHLLQYLPEYMIPTAFMAMDYFPLTANNKLDKQAFPLPHGQSSRVFRAAQTDLEKTLAEIWAEELAVKNPGLDDDFFELGGHSLSAARILSHMHRVLKKDVSLKDLYESPTIAQLAVLVEQANDLNHQMQRNLNDNKPFPLGNFQFLLWSSTVFAPNARRMNLVSRKRLVGPLKEKAMHFAFQAIFRKHEVFTYRLYRFQPEQILDKELAFTLENVNLQRFSAAKQDAILNYSLKNLSLATWSAHQPLLKATLFHLSNQQYELHIALPHIISDEVSMDILWTDLSLFYQSSRKNASWAQLFTLSTDKLFRQYIHNEQDHMQNSLKQDIAFWETWLKDSSLFAFPKEHIITNMKATQTPYSTWIPISQALLEKLQSFCMNHQLNLHDSICAALSLALFKLGNPTENRNVFINLVKSTRHDPEYDDTMGCFLRLEPIRILQEHAINLRDLTLKIRESTIESMPWQTCSSLVKLACVGMYQKRNRIKSFFVRLFTSLYSKLFHLSLYDKQVFTLAHRLAKKIGNQFLININIQNTFQRDLQTEEANGLFGLKTQSLTTPKTDLLQIDNVFDVVFFADEQKAVWLVISANLQPDFRAAIGKEFIEIIQQEVGNESVKKRRFDVIN